MRVAFVSEYPASPDRVVGGVQAVVRQLATEMAGRDGFDVHAVSFDRDLQGARTDTMEGVRVHRFPATPRLGNLTMGRAERRTTARALREIAPDVAHAHVLGPPALGAAESGVPWLATAHGMQEAEGRTLRGPANRVRALTHVRMERRSLRALRHLIVISPYVLEYFGGRLDGIVTHAIENPVEERFFGASPPGDPRVILFSGRLIPRKDVETLLEAAGRLARDGVEFRLRLAGDADDPVYRRDLEHRARAAGVAERTAFLGSLPPVELVRELEGAGVYVQSSRQETASLSVMEAMAAGLPVVATDVGGTRHLVEDGRSGRLVPPADPASLAGALAEYLHAPDSAIRAGRAGREIAERRFRARAVVDRTVEVYEELLAGIPARSTS